MKTKYSILGCPCFAVNEDDAVDHILSIVESSQAGYSVAINAEKIWRYGKDVEFTSIVDKSVFPYPDGAGAVLGLKWLHGIKSQKNNMPIKALEAANKGGLKTFIIGANEANHNKAIDIIVSRYPELDLVGHMHGYHGKQDIIQAVARVRPQLILVAMGSPRQELFAAELLSKVNSGFVIGCGGALDILSGALNRAPQFMIDNNLEWFYRLYKQPWRFRRQLFLPVFIMRLYIASVLRRLNP
ncbi:WecB/TagA/CpsF family glycosyltransferase [Porticoccaceae bacterium]|jgi:N-acetylglucosaminyldiphosphoundecaprenol N-acetyl-beta-D-mannosaminyltransferase|nr:WecB/TagA/CpsF family glycosyltransferase [Porticoccaceae bacterium]